MKKTGAPPQSVLIQFSGAGADFVENSIFWVSQEVAVVKISLKKKKKSILHSIFVAVSMDLKQLKSMPMYCYINYGILYFHTRQS